MSVIPQVNDKRFGSHLLPQWIKEIYPQQWEAVQQTVEAFNNGDKVVWLDAPTGSGKTLIGELVRRELTTKALYVCSNKSLQDQFISDFAYARLLKGRSNYPTADRPEDFNFTATSLSASDCTKARVITPACSTCPEGRSEELLHCNWCHPVTSCPYEQAKDEALYADIAVLNMSYFLTEANNIGRFSDKFGLIIVDEADLLEQELMSLIEVRITPRLQKELGINPPYKKTVEESWVSWVAKEAIPKVDKARRSVREGTTNVDAIRKKQKYDRLFKKLLTLQEGLGKGNWIYDGYAQNQIVFKPITVASYGQQMLWRHSQRFLCMSATLISPDSMAETLGLVGE